MKFDIDVNGIVSVTAKDLATNKEQKITITANSGLSDNDIDRMVRDAEMFAEEDEKRLKEIETRNNADSMIYQADKTIKEMAEQMEDADRDAINNAKEDLIKALEGNDIEEIEAKTEALTTAMYAFTAKVYENMNPQGAGDDGVFDADYNIPDDDK